MSSGRFVRIAALSALALIALPNLAGAHDYQSGPLTIFHPWSRATPEGAKVAGGYLKITNSSSEPDRLVAVSAEISGSTEIHEMAVKDNVMQMRMLDNGLQIPANGEVELKPRSFHLMFMSPTRSLKAGDSFKGTLTFEKAGKVAVEFKVEAMGANPPAHAGH